MGNRERHTEADISGWCRCVRSRDGGNTDGNGLGEGGFSYGGGVFAYEAMMKRWRCFI